MNSTKDDRRGCALPAGFIFLAAGLFFLGATLLGEARLAVFGEKTEGVVTKVTSRVSYSSSPRKKGESHASYQDRSGPSVTYVLSVAFTTAHGSPEAFDTVSTWGHEMKEGDTVEVVYLPKHPATAEIYSARQLWLPLAVGSVVTLTTLGIGGMLIRKGIRRKRP
ncbi:MAG: DUF3592 domain-containing protein [Verrucomicrobiae bacterium]|nr:DUF3592 domain-containing protein [Verrucomicrobiae bacterium]